MTSARQVFEQHSLPADQVDLDRGDNEPIYRETGDAEVRLRFHSWRDFATPKLAFAHAEAILAALAEYRVLNRSRVCVAIVSDNLTGIGTSRQWRAFLDLRLAPIGTGAITGSAQPAVSGDLSTTQTLPDVPLVFTGRYSPTPPE